MAKVKYSISKKEFYNKFAGIRKIPKRAKRWYFNNKAGAQQGGKWGRPPLSFFENKKKCYGFGKKDLIVFIFGLKIFIQNVVLRVSRTKNSKIITCACKAKSIVKEV